jgi:putative effector of murein hydrolase
MYDLLKEFIKPELLVLIPVLYLYGVGLKKSQVADKYIPILLGIASVVLSFLWIVATSVLNGWQEVLMAIFLGITQGVLCAGASVYVNQIFKQSGKEE